MGNCASGGNDVASTKQSVRNSSSKRNSNAESSQKQHQQNSQVKAVKIQEEHNEHRNSSQQQNGYEKDPHNRESQSNQHEMVAGDVQPQDLEPVQADDQADEEPAAEPKSASGDAGGQTNSKRGPIIDREHALTQACGDEEFLVEILGDVIAEKDETCSKIRVAIQENDHKALAETAHTIKGSALNLALNALASVAKDLEQLGKELRKEEDEQKLSKRTPYLNEMEFEYQRIQKYVAEEWPDG